MALHLLDPWVLPAAEVHLEAKASARLTAGFSIIGICITSVTLALMIFFPHWLPARTDFLSRLISALPLLFSLVAYYFSRTRLFYAGGILLILGAFVGLIGQVIINPVAEIARPVMTYFYLIPLICSLILGWRMTLGASLLCVFALLSIKISVRDIPLHDLSIQLISLFTGAGLAMVGAFLRQAAEKEADLQRSKLMAAAKLTALGEMSAGIAHEINSPLTVILGRVGILKNKTREGGVNSELILKNFELIENMSIRIRKIVRSLRTFARDGALDLLEPTSVGQLVEDCLAMCQERIKAAGIHFSVVLPPNDLQFDCRQVQICQILVNLLNNAYDAILTQPQSERWIRLSVDFSEVDVLFEISNSGPKIPSHLETKIFQPFFTTKDVGEGTGLGLSISLGIAKSHGGDLWLDTRCDHVKFVMKVPRIHVPGPVSRPSRVEKLFINK